MKKTRAIWILGLIILCMGTACAVPEEKREEPVPIDYSQALVMDEYTIADYTDAVKVTDPNGNRVEMQGATFVLLVSGEYVIDYGNGKRQSVQVFVNPPKVGFTLEKELEASYTAGQILYFPRAIADNGYRRFDDYYIDVFRGEERKTRLEKAGTGTPNYFFAESGAYRIIYGLVDNFGEENSAEYEVTVTDKEQIFFDALPESVNISEILRVGFPYGYYLGKNYAVEVRVKAPSGGERVLTEPHFTVNEVGTYQVDYSAHINGKSVLRTQSVKVVNPGASFYFSRGTGEVTEGVLLPEYIKNHEAKGTKGTLVRSSDLSASFYYNEVIDLKNLPSDGSLIEFVPYSEGEEKYVGYIRITLSDIYDPNNKVSLFFQSAAKPYLDTSYVIVEMNGFSAGVCNENGPRYGQILNSAGTTLYGNSLRGDFVGESRIFRMYFDYDEMAFYTEGRNDLIQYGRQIVLDLNNQNHVELSRQFKGFTTGEVVMSIELTNNNNAGLYIKSVAGKAPVLSEDLSEVMIRFDSPEFPNGIVGSAYTFPNAVKSPLCDVPDAIAFTLMKGETNLTAEVRNGSFTPREAGTYLLSYTLPYRGSILKRELEWTVLTEPAEIVIVCPENQSAGYLEEYFLPVDAVAVSGGNGSLTVSYTVTAGGREILPGIGGGYLVSELSGLEVTVTVWDSLGFTQSKRFSVSVRDGVFADLSWRLPHSVRIGETLVLPDFEAYEIADGNLRTISDRRILVWADGTQTELEPGASFRIPECSVLRVEFQVMGDSGYVTRQSSELLMLAENFSDSASVFGISSGITTKVLESGIVFSLPEKDGKQTISLPNFIAADKTYLKFSIHDDAAAFGIFSVLLTDIETGNVLRLNFSDYDSDKGILRLRIGKDGAAFLLTGAKNRYTDQAGNDTDTEFYRGKSYTSFEITVNSLTKSIENSIRNNTVAFFDSFENGKKFYSFTDSACILSFETEDVTGVCEIVIGAVTNQSFNYTIQNLGGEGLRQCGTADRHFGHLFRSDDRHRQRIYGGQRARL